MHFYATTGYSNKLEMMTMKTGWLLILLGFLCLPAIAQQDGNGEAESSDNLEVQEVMYVTDKLRLSLYKSPDSNSGIMKLLISGDELDILEKSGPYSRVRTSENLIGWVKNGFLVSTKTSNLLLEQELQKNRDLQQRIERFSDTEALIRDYEDSISRMQADLDGLQQQLEQSQASNQQLNDDKQQLENRLQELLNPGHGMDLRELGERALRYWYIIAAMVLILILIGFLVGKLIVESQVRRRFQGVKVW